MKKMILAIFIWVFVLGCAQSGSNSYLNTSSPIFILNKPNDKNVYLDFKDKDTNATIADTLRKNGYSFLSSEKFASIIIKGDINYFKENRDDANHGFIALGYGFGSRGRRYRSLDVGLSHRFFADGYSGEYEGQASLLIRIREIQKELKNYSTNLNFQTDDSTYSKGYAKSLFDKKIAQKILEYLTFK